MTIAVKKITGIARASVKKIEGVLNRTLITFDTSTGVSASGVSNSTWSHTCTGSNRLLLVGVSSSAGSISGVTYNGVAMTQINTAAVGGTTFNNIYLFYLVNPASGAHNIVATASGSGFIYSDAASYSGVDQSNPLDVNNTNVLTDTAITCSVTTTVDNDFLAGWMIKGSGSGGVGENSAGANTTLRSNVSSGGWCVFFDSNSAQTPTGSKAQNITLSTSRLAGMCIVALREVPTIVKKFAGVSNV